MVELLDVADPIPTETLGCGTHRAFIYDRGGEYRIGEITPLASIEWHRTRDDISTAQLTTAGFGRDCCDLMSGLYSMRHELVIFRDGVRVWEGPVREVSWQADHVEIFASDVMYYIYRRILRDGYDDRYIYKKPPDTSINNIKTVVQRAMLLAQDALARDDPNVSQFLTAFNRNDDAKESRHLLPFQVTVWEEIDELAANNGLDYVTVGRRIMFWDTHNAIGRLPVMDDSAFLANPIITEYGASLITFSAVSDGMGNYGTAGGASDFYGLVEKLASSYSGKGPPQTAKDLTKLHNDRVAAEAKYREARAAYLRGSGLSHAEAVQLAQWETERGTPGVLPARQKWLDAHIKVLRDRANTKAGLKTAMDHAKTEYDNAVTAETDAAAAFHEYMKALRSQAHRNLQGHNPSPIQVRVPDNSQLNPNISIGINELVPGVWIPLRSDVTCKTLVQWQKLDSVTVTEATGSAEQVTVVMSPAPGLGATPVDVTADETGG
jgi:hypothetical protein